MVKDSEKTGQVDDLPAGEDKALNFTEGEGGRAEGGLEVLRQSGQRLPV